MAILGAAPSSAPAAPCCADCATPAQRRQIHTLGAALVLGAASSGRKPYPELLGTMETDYLPNRDEVKSATEELNGKILAFQKDTVDQVAGGSINQDALQGFLAAWNSFISDWQDWRGSTAWEYVPFASAARRNALLAYRKKLQDLFDYWNRLPGSTPSTVTGYTPDETGDDSTSPWVTGAKWTAIAALGLAGAYAVAKVTGLAAKFTPEGFAAGAARIATRRNPSRRRRRRRRSHAACCS